jgi:uroporphyrin-III C-methyltransferase/precorrin-2 dehydrogenase/sirohydrochlorin ferrochelatase
MGERRNALLEALARLHREASGSRRRTARRPAGARRSPPRPPGLVSLVGAGPGDPELLTRLAARRLAEADLVLYDALVAPAAVSLARHAQQISVGRRRGWSTLGQEAVIRTMIRAARRGRRVVRLKGGDPFVFGRGGEEAAALAAAGVAFEIVPGVSSAFAAPAAASIPVTHRGLSGAVLVTSGHDAERFARLVSPVPDAAATLVVLMGTTRRPEIAAALVDAGWRASTPAAIVWSASLPEQAVWTGTVGTLASAPDRDEAGTIVIGEVVALRERLAAEAEPVRQEVRHG